MKYAIDPVESEFSVPDNKKYAYLDPHPNTLNRNRSDIHQNNNSGGFYFLPPEIPDFFMCSNRLFFPLMDPLWYCCQIMNISE